MQPDRLPSARETPLAAAGRYAAVCLLALISLLLFTVLHEGGHALFGLLFGGTLTAFSANFWELTAHVSLDGEFTPWQQGLISVAGVGLPFFVWAVLMLVLPRRLDAAASWLRAIASLAVINSLLPWVVIPILYLQGQAPVDDSASFLLRTQAPPLLVAATALLVWVGGWALFLERVGGPRALVTSLGREARELGTPAARATLRGLAAVGLVVSLLAVGLNVYLERTAPLGLPSGYAQVASLDLAQADRVEEVAYRFTLADEAKVSLYVVVNTSGSGAGHVELALAGPAGYRNTFFKSPNGVGPMRATIHPRDLQLGPGDYTVLCTFPRTPGRLELFVKTEPPVGRG